MARPDLDALLNAALPFAQEMLAKRGAFYPFGAAMQSDGKIVQTAGYTGEEFPEPQELIQLLLGAFRAQAEKGDVRATALRLDARTIPPGESKKMDAICVRLEHADGEAIDVFLPYRKASSGQITYTQLFAAQAEPNVFGPDRFP